MFEIKGPTSIKDNAIRSGKWALIARVSQVFGSGILLLVLPHWLEPDEFGVITMFSSVLALGLLIQQAGFAEATIRGDENAEDIRDIAFWLNFVVSILMYILLFFLSPLISSFFYDSRLIIPLRVGGLQIILAGISNVPMAWLQRTFRFQHFALIHFIGAIVMVVVTVLLANRGFGYWAYVSGILGGSAVRMILALFFLDWKPRLKFRRGYVMYVLKFSGVVLLEMILGWFLVWFDNIVVARHLGSHSAGIYSLAFNIATLTISLPCSGITGLTLPTFSRLQNDISALRTAYLRGTGLISAYVIPAGIGMYLLGSWVIRIVYPSHWEELGSILSILALYSSFGYLWILNTDVFKAIGKPEFMVKIYIFSVIVILPIYWWSSQIGLSQFAIARSLIVFVGALPHTYFAIRYLHLEKNYLWILIRAPLAASVFMAICVWSGGMIFQGFLFEGGISLFIVIGLMMTGAAVYFAVLRFLEPEFVQQAYSLLLRSAKQTVA